MRKIRSIAIIIISLLTLANGSSFAQGRSEKQEKSAKTAKIHKNKRKKVAVVKTNQFPRSKVVVVKQRNIRTVPSLAVGYSTIPFRGKNYYYHNGHYYNQFNNNYTIIAVPALQEDNVEEITIDGQVYYEYDNMLYRAIVTTSGTEYEVVGKLDD